MDSALVALDQEWQRLARSAEARAALARWGSAEPALAGLDDLEALLARRTDRDAAPFVLAALARLASSDLLATRTLLQALLPGLVRLASTEGRGDHHAIGVMVSLAWERIRTYPIRRPGSVAGNVLLDVGKRYRRERRAEASEGVPVEPITMASPSAEEVALAQGPVAQLAAAVREGVITSSDLRLIVLTRLKDEPLRAVATQDASDLALLNCRRWRAERRLRREWAEAS